METKKIIILLLLFVLSSSSCSNKKKVSISKKKICKIEKREYKQKMTDVEILREIEAIIRKSNIHISDYDKIYGLIENINNINVKYGEDNILYIITRVFFYENIYDNKGAFVEQKLDIFKYNQTIRLINLILDKGFDKSNTSGTYNEPALFYIEVPELFEYLCKKGFDPNTRLTGALTDYPYFISHHDFQWEIYKIAKKYGFDTSVPIGKEGFKVIHLIFRYYTDFPIGTLNNICKEFKDDINTPDPENGLPPLLEFITNIGFSEFSYNDIKILLENGANPNFKITKKFSINEWQIKAGMTVYEAVQSYIPTSSGSKYWKIKTLNLLNKY